MAGFIPHWRSLIWRAAAAPTFTISGVRKIASDMSLNMPWEDLVAGGFDYTDLCYTRAKERQLLRNYWDQAEVDAAMTKLAGRKGKDHSSVSIQMRGQVKDSRSQGFCMQNTVISMTKEDLTVDIYYRSTELIQKFAADLVFFSNQLPPLFDALGRTPSVVRMRFANVYISAVFVPILVRYEPDPMAFFQHLSEHDAHFYRTCGLAARRFFDESHNYTYRTRVKMFNYWKEHVDERKLRKLEKLLRGLKGDINLTTKEMTNELDQTRFPTGSRSGSRCRSSDAQRNRARHPHAGEANRDRSLGGRSREGSRRRE
jgi:hypothetical protein